MIRARTRARTGGQPPLIPSWTVTPENLPPGYTYTGGLRTQVNQDGSIGWAPHNLLSNSDLKTAGTSTLSVAESAGNVIDNGLDASVLDPLGGVGARKVTFNATSLVRLRPASGASSGYPGTPYSGRVWLRTTDGVARTLRFQVNDQPTFSSAGITVDGTWREFTRTATGTGNFQFIDIESDGGGFSLHLWGGHLNVGAAQPYLATTNSARFEPRTADYSDSMEPVLGPELLPNSGFNTDLSGWAPSGSSAPTLTQGAGVATLSFPNSGSGVVASTVTLVPNKRYRIVIVVTAKSGTFYARTSGGGMDAQFLALNVGTNTFQDVSPTVSGTFSPGNVGTLPAASFLSIDSISVKEIIGYAGTRRGIKLEPQATNLLPNSEALGATIGPGQASAPTGWTYAGQGATWSTVGTGIVGSARYTDVRLQGTLTALNPYIDAATLTAVTVAPGSQYTASVSAQLIAGTTRNAYCVVRFGTDAGGYVSDAGGTIRPLSSTPWTYTVTAAPAAGGVRGVLRLTIQGAVNDVVDVTLRIWAPQFEAGAVATSYIPTYGSQVTRVEDILYWPTSAVSGWSNSSNRTTVVSLSSAYNIAPSTLVRVLEYISPGNATYDYLARNGVNAPAFGREGGGTGSAGYFLDGAGKVALTSNDAAMRYASSFQAGVLGFGQPGVPNVDRLYFGNRVGGSRALTGSIYRIDYYPRAANEAQLARLTATV